MHKCGLCMCHFLGQARSLALGASAVLLALGVLISRPGEAGVHGITLVVAPDHPLAARGAVVHENYGRLPLSFEANQGQSSPEVKFLAHTFAYSVFLTPTGIVVGLPAAGRSILRSGAGAQRLHAASMVRERLVHLAFIDANPHARLIGLNALPGKVNYLIGRDPSGWHTNIPTFARVEYRELYPGVDLVMRGASGHLEYAFVISPHAKIDRIRIALEGATKVALDREGSVVLQVGAGVIRQSPPRAFQVLNGRARQVQVHYQIGPGHQIGLALPRYDEGKSLVIDPSLLFSTYLGGSGDEDASGIAVDPAGDAYVAGLTTSPNFPVCPNPAATDPCAASSAAMPVEPTYQAGEDAFVSEINAAGTALVYSTYLGGQGDNEGTAIAVDASGDAYVTGETDSPDFPTCPTIFYPLYCLSSGPPGPPQPTKPSMNSDYEAFVTKLSPDGSKLVYSTYLGGNADDEAQGIAVGGTGGVGASCTRACVAYVAGRTKSTSLFPICPQPVATAPCASTGMPLQASHSADGGNWDAFVTAFTPDGTRLVYSTYFGGGGADEAYGIAVDAVGSPYIAGQTTSTDLPVCPGSGLQCLSSGGLPLQPKHAPDGGKFDAFVAKLDPTGTKLAYSTYLGASGDDEAYGIAVDGAGSAYVTGFTDSTDLPTCPSSNRTSGLDPCTTSTGSPVQPANAGGIDAFAARLNPAGTQLAYNTYLGGSGTDQGSGIAVDSAGDAYVIGSTSSNDFPTSNPIQAQHAADGGQDDAFVTELDPAGTPPLPFSTYLGGTGDDEGSGIALDQANSVFISGETTSTDFPTHNPLQPANASSSTCVPAAAGQRNCRDAFVAKLSSGPTAARVSVFRLSRHGRIITFRWNLATAASVVGYDVYGGRQKLNARLVAAHRNQNYRFDAVWSGRALVSLHAVLMSGRQTIVATARQNS